jgi:hypothetical protein
MDFNEASAFMQFGSASTSLIKTNTHLKYYANDNSCKSPLKVILWGILHKQR